MNERSFIVKSDSTAISLGRMPLCVLQNSVPANLAKDASASAESFGTRRSAAPLSFEYLDTLFRISSPTLLPRRVATQPALVALRGPSLSEWIWGRLPDELARSRRPHSKCKSHIPLFPSCPGLSLPSRTRSPYID